MSIFTYADLRDRIDRGRLLKRVRKVVRDVADSVESVTDSTDTNVTALGPGSPEELTETGAVTAGVRVLELNHATVIIEAAIASAVNHPGMFVVTDTSASGTAAHTVTLTVGTFDGTNNTATLDAPAELLVVYFDAAGAGTIVQNTGSVALSSV